MATKPMSKKAATAALLGEPITGGQEENDQPPAKKKKIKKETDASSSSSTTTTIPLDRQIVKLLSGAPNGLTPDEICSAIGIKPSDMLNDINELLLRHRVELMTNTLGQYFYKLVSADKVKKLVGLTSSELAIYQHIEKAGDKCSWIKDLRIKTNLSALEIPKILKELIKRKLIKEVKSIEATKKKLYVLFDIEPARSVSGGIFYDESGTFKDDLVKGMEEVIVKVMRDKYLKKMKEQGELLRSGSSLGGGSESGHATAVELESLFAGVGIFTPMPSLEELTQLLESLVYDGRLEKEEDLSDDWMLESSTKIKPSIAASSASSALDPSRKRKREQHMSYVYRYVRAGLFQSSFTNIPCATCPVARSCHEGNPISPQSCEYLTKWLSF